MQHINLAVEGYPNYELFRDGHIKNLITGQLKVPAKVVSLYRNGTHEYFNVPVLIRRYFGNEFDEVPEDQKKNLAFLGFPMYEVTFDGRLWTHRTESWMYPEAVNSNGYVTVTLSNDKGPKSFKLHRLVALAFCPNPNNYDQVDHKDGNKTHNWAMNLEWVDGVENARRARLLGFKSMAITDEGVHKACKMIQDGYTDTEIAKEVGTYSAIIYHIRTGHTHCEIASKYGIIPNRIRGREIDWSKYKKHHTKYKHYVPKV